MKILKENEYIGIENKLSKLPDTIFSLEDYLVNDIDILKLSRRILPKLKHYKLDNIISYYYLKKTYSIKRLYLNKPSV